PGLHAARRCTRMRPELPMTRLLAHLAVLAGVAAGAAACSPARPQSAATVDAVPRLSNEAVAQAQAFAASLTDAQRAIGRFPFDAEERYTFNYVPMVRGGVPLGEMTDAQREQAYALLQLALSPGGFETAKKIVAHEAILRELERQRGVRNYDRRNPDLYYLAIFGEPGASPWGWRFEGHHLSVNVTHGGAEGD